MNEPKPENQDATLEEPSTVVESGSSTPIETDQSLDGAGLSNETIDASTTLATEPGATKTPNQKNEAPKKPKLRERITQLRHRFNIYLLLFVLIVLIALVVTGLSVYSNSKNNNKPPVSTQTLSSSTLKQLANSDATVGDPKQVLTVQSNAVFGGKVLIRDGLEVAGPLQVGGSLSLTGITVSGNSSFDQVQVRNNLTVGGSTSVQGLAVQKGLTVSGGATFSGAVTASQINTSNLQITGDFMLSHHLVAGGATPSRSNGSALGSGGTSSVSGSDTAGTLTVNTGGSPSGGCFATITFAQKFSNTPRVMVTPVGATAGSLDYYTDRSTSGFSICTASPAPAGQSFSFDYFVVD
jgi:hypothetical protein